MSNINWGRLGQMLCWSLLLFAALSARGIPQNDCLYRESDILDDSEIGYVVKKPWTERSMVSRGGRPIPSRYKIRVFSSKGRCYITRGEIWQGRYVEKKRKKIACIRYLVLWKSLENLGIWTKESKTAAILHEKIQGKKPEEAEKIIFEMYESLELETDVLDFTIRVKNQEHTFKANNVERLRDKTYVKIRDEIHQLVYGNKPIKNQATG